jgi:hypothetical protein
MTTHNSRIRKAAQTRLGIAAVIAILVGAFVAWPKYTELTTKRAEIAQFRSEIVATETNLAEEREIYRALKVSYAKQAEEDKNSVSVILPETPDQTSIVRAVEAFTNSLNSSRSRLLLKSIDFGKVVEEKDVDYLTVPFKVTVNTTIENLPNLLRYFERSGEIRSENSERLMEIREINIQIDDKLTASEAARLLKGPVDIDLLINAYILPTGEKTAKAK